VQFNRLLEVGKSFLLGLPLAGEVEFQALGDIPLPLTPNGSRKWSLQGLIVSQARVLRTGARVLQNLSGHGQRNRGLIGIQYAFCRDRRNRRGLEVARCGHHGTNPTAVAFPPRDTPRWHCRHRLR
jgi:hypothetical protein